MTYTLAQRRHLTDESTRRSIRAGRLHKTARAEQDVALTSVFTAGAWLNSELSSLIDAALLADKSPAEAA